MARGKELGNVPFLLSREQQPDGVAQAMSVAPKEG